MRPGLGFCFFLKEGYHINYCDSLTIYYLLKYILAAEKNRNKAQHFLF